MSEKDHSGGYEITANMTVLVTVKFAMTGRNTLDDVVKLAARNAESIVRDALKDRIDDTSILRSLGGVEANLRTIDVLQRNEKTDESRQT